MTEFRLVSGRQLKAARALAGLSQRELSLACNLNPKACRYWEGKGDKPPTNVAWTLNRIEQTLEKYGVTVFDKPTPGARLSDDHTREA
jgi:DNA-binding transcriptional regulator YiaG